MLISYAHTSLSYMHAASPTFSFVDKWLPNMSNCITHLFYIALKINHFVKLQSYAFVFLAHYLIYVYVCVSIYIYIFKPFLVFFFFYRKNMSCDDKLSVVFMVNYKLTHHVFGV